MYKKIGQQLLVVVFFAVLSLVYFAPGITDGKVLMQGDINRFIGMSQELTDHYQKEGKGSAWTGSMFSGMPAYHIAMYGTPKNFLDYVEIAVKRIDYQGASMVLTGLLCFYLLMCVMGVSRWLAIAGAIAFAFASYNIIIIIAGHITKAYVIAYMPLTLAGMCLLFKQKWLWGAVLFTLGVSLSIMNNHMQITYYLFLFCLFFYLGYLFLSIREKTYPALAKASALMAVCVILAVLPNIGNLYSNYEQAQESMRGPSELTAATTGETARPSTGLDLDYAFEWSYGKGELLTLLVPDAYGGESGGTVDASSELYKALRARGQSVGDKIQTYTYWGDQMFTSGPVYFGAVVCFLFVLGMFVIGSPIKWWMFAGSVFFIFLALGRNLGNIGLKWEYYFPFIAGYMLIAYLQKGWFEKDLKKRARKVGMRLLWGTVIFAVLFFVTRWIGDFNTFMFHYLPMFNKFRTPSMALVVPGLVFPLIGIWGLSLILRQKVAEARFRTGFFWALGLTGGLCLVLWLAPGLFLDFRSALDGQYQLPDWYYNALVQDRRSLAQADALRSLLFILLTAALLLWFNRAKDKKKTANWVGIGLIVLMLADLWPVDKRYLDYNDFVTPRAALSYEASAADREILKDTDPSYRVLNLNNPFQDAATSYFHKSVGGYHPAKLRRYQELIDYRLTPELQSIYTAFRSARSADDLSEAFRSATSLNMLNTRYIIYNPQQPPVRNPYAYGNAWFVDAFETVGNADAEMAALQTLQPLEKAVVDRRFAPQLEGLALRPDSAARIELVSYKPDELVYKTTASSEQLAVFSEVYYPYGWKVTIDGEPAPHFRADWVLRAMRVPAGEHTIVFRFEPDTFNRLASAASAGSAVILLLLIAAIVYSLWKMKTKKDEDIVI